MYAIRSYYAAAGRRAWPVHAQDRLAGRGAGAVRGVARNPDGGGAAHGRADRRRRLPGPGAVRITSYNVCYTKLLRRTMQK